MGESHAFLHLSIHQILSDGPVKDVVLWRKRYASGLLLVCATLMWILFARAGYSPLSFIANVLLFLVVILFFWAKSASLLNRPLPPIPDMEVSDNIIEEAANVITVWVNRALGVAHDILICGNLRLLVKIVVLLGVISFIGDLFNLVTFVYMGILLALSFPVLYDKHQGRVDGILLIVNMLLQTGYKKLDDAAFRKVPVSLYKKKKSQ